MENRPTRIAHIVEPESTCKSRSSEAMVHIKSAYSALSWPSCSCGGLYLEEDDKTWTRGEKGHLHLSLLTYHNKQLLRKQDYTLTLFMIRADLCDAFRRHTCSFYPVDDSLILSQNPSLHGEAAGGRRQTAE